MSAGRFDGFHALPALVSKTCPVRFHNNKYSVSASMVGRPVDIHVYAERIMIRQDGASRQNVHAAMGAAQPYTIRGRHRPPPDKCRPQARPGAVSCLDVYGPRLIATGLAKAGPKVTTEHRPADNIPSSERGEDMTTLATRAKPREAASSAGFVQL
jgi:hypothetical protein